MKIEVKYFDNSAIDVVNIITAEYISDYKIKVFFDDSTSKTIDFESFLKKSIHTSINKYLEKINFKNYRIIDGNLNWNDYDLIFPIWDLHEGVVK